MSTVSCDPLEQFTISLERHADWPIETRPTFTFRRLNGREYLRLAKTVDWNSLNEKNPDEACDALYAGLALGLMGWKNQTDPSTGQVVEFDPSKLPDVIDPLSAGVLIQQRLAYAHVTPEQKKTSESVP